MKQTVFQLHLFWCKWRKKGPSPCYLVCCVALKAVGFCLYRTGVSLTSRAGITFEEINSFRCYVGKKHACTCDCVHVFTNAYFCFLCVWRLGVEGLYLLCLWCSQLHPFVSRETQGGDNIVAHYCPKTADSYVHWTVIGHGGIMWSFHLKRSVAETEQKSWVQSKKRVPCKMRTCGLWQCLLFCLIGSTGRSNEQFLCCKRHSVNISFFSHAGFRANSSFVALGQKTVKNKIRPHTVWPCNLHTVNATMCDRTLCTDCTSNLRLQLI